ncbi:MAG: PilZ domain-containing protein, partial [Bacillota bacterium]|nr:PilZ domain-containing protein [Bacillota bacterium]
TRVVRSTPDRLIVELPRQEGGRYASGTPGMEVTLEYADERGLYCLRSRLVGFDLQGMGRWMLERPTLVEKRQRRLLFRLATLLNVRFRVPGDPHLYHGLARDISGGGIQLVHWKEMAPGTELDLAIELPGRVLPVRGRIVTADTLEEVPQQVADLLGVKAKRTYGIQFTQLDQATQDEIVRFVFERQREQLRKRCF